MKHVAAYLLCQLGGNSKPSEADVNKILSSVGIEADSDKLGKLLSSLEGKDLWRSSRPARPRWRRCRRAAVAAAAAAAAAAAVAAAAAAATPGGGGGGGGGAAAPPAEEEEEEEMGFDLFD